MTRKLLLYKNGITDPTLACDIGCYESWFARVLGEATSLEVHLGFEAPRRALDGYDGLILTGSPRSLAEPEPWMDDAAELVREAERVGLPTLGVCFGHQLIGHAFGAKVRVNPNGWEVGTCEVSLTSTGRRDSLFDGLPPRLRVNQSHRDEVTDLGANITPLATNMHSINQAIAVGDRVRGVQFHPELSGETVRRIIQYRHAILAADALKHNRGASAHPDVLAQRTVDTPEAERVLRNFLVHFVKS